MKHAQRVLALLLTAALGTSSLGALPAYADPVSSGAAAATGTLSATLRFDYRQELKEVQRRDLQVALVSSTGSTLGTYPLTTAATQQIPADGKAPAAQVTAKNPDGGIMNGEDIIGFYDITIPDLPLGSYTLKFIGTGYKAYETNAVKLDDFSKHIILGTGDATFSIGDLNGDGKVNDGDDENNDLTIMKNSLGKTDEVSLALCDLNGDGKIDIVDLAYVNHQIGAKGGAEVKNTSAIVSADVLNTESVVIEGDAGSLFTDDGQAVKLTAAGAPEEGALVTLPIEFPKETPMEQVEITSPQTNGAVKSGTAVVEYTENGETKSMDVPFDITAPEGLLAIGRTAGSSTVTINLGKRVPVKKITIKVEKVEGTDSYAVIEQIKFLQDIVPENPVAPNTKVKTVTTKPSNEKVTLKWSELPNVSKYRVNYGESGGELKGSIFSTVTSAEVPGLKNLIAYDFTVTPMSDDGWEGIPSEIVTETPQPEAVPSPPDFLTVKEMDGALRLGWGKSKNATGYRVYIKEDGETAYKKVGGDLTDLSYTFSGLKNDTKYQLCVSAFNEMGESGKSKPVEGTPYAVKFEEPEGIPTGGRMDRENLESVYLTDKNNYDTAEYPNKDFKIDSVADGDYSTHWTSQSYGHGNWSRDKTVNFVFESPMDMNNIVFVPRLDGTYRNNLRLYTVTVWHDGDNLNGAGTVVANGLPVKNNPSATGFATLPFDPQYNVKKVAIKIEQQGYMAVSLSEIIFYNYDPDKDLDKQISALFSDELCTKLKDGVTENQIGELQTRLDSNEQNYYLNVNTMKDELTLATSLLGGNTSALGRVVNGIESRNADGGKDYNGGQGGSALQPLGVVAKANTEITVYASGIPEGASVNLTATQFTAEASAWSAGLGKLTNGRNIFTVPKIGSQTTERGGSLYLTYAGEHADQIKLHIRRTTQIPMLQLADWDKLDETARRDRIGAYVDELNTYTAALPKNNIQSQIKNSTEISMPHMLLSIPAMPVKTAMSDEKEKQIDKLYNNVLAWEEVAKITTYTQGIDDNSQMQARQNIRCMQMFAGAFMYAAGSHIGVGYGSCSGAVSGRPTDANTPNENGNHLFGWGFAHEIGHNMDKLGKAEITNNIYSIMVQTYDGAANTRPSRLETSNKYDGIFEKTSIGYPGAANDVFVQLGMYWQLHLAYDDADKPMDFYNRFFKSWKAGGMNSAYSYDEKVAVTASKTADRNLTEFFTRWGAQLGAEAKAEMAALPTEDRAIWYLNDESRRSRINGNTASSGTVTADVAVDPSNEKQVLLSFSASADPSSIQGYEIIRNGKSIAFVPYGDTYEEKYTDLIGSANNQTFNYVVKAYDKLGNAIGQSAGEEIRISYDKTIDPSEYKLTQAPDGTITAEFNDPMAVSGIKVTNAPATGSFTVSVKSTATAAAVTAKEGDFSKSDAASDKDYYMSYFNKPGAAADDTRIWTFDASVITITGVPAGSEVSFISYAGDNITFGEDVVMGRLKTDYTYDTTEGPETIKAGTLVITGNYRGDPIFNTLRIEGRYVSTSMKEDGSDQTPTETERTIAGDVLMFAEVPEDGEVSDISDGFFLFIPDMQNEAELQPNVSSCDVASLLPAMIRAELYRTDDPNNTDSTRVTSSTLWIGTPSFDSMPDIVLEGVKE